ncbi:hypothetical protein Q1W71_04090 [Flavobacterium pectinovorum]|uniref:hypothetical protein n=1 Tax=Flavobacterium pectinovorum TaxID=29533 RepID=UPI00265DB28F|nr:hypothetical protein [Flavobacterium pectinovorum]WKL48967.1 hypothetical protein Q1W71_04090 [Flavobacterium pectinovorum]
MKFKNILCKRQFEIISSLESEAIIAKLKLITYKYNSNQFEKNQFEGKIENDNFKILPIFDFGPREQLRPEINGIIKNNEKNKVIKLEFEIPNLLLYLLILILNFSIVIYLFIKPIKNESFLTWKFFLFVIILTFFMFCSYLNVKIKKSIKILSRTLEGNEKNIC